MLICCAAVALTACENDQFIEGYYCHLNEDSTFTVYVESYEVEEVEIPDMIGGIRVTGVRAPKKVQKINTKLTTVKLPDTLLRIEEEAFKNCVALKEINFPKSLLSIGARAFENCSSLEEIRLPNGLTTIITNAFLSCLSLKRAYVPASVTDSGMGNAVFSHCYELEIWVARDEEPSAWNNFWGCWIDDSVKEVHWGYTGYDEDVK